MDSDDRHLKRLRLLHFIQAGLQFIWLAWLIGHYFFLQHWLTKDFATNAPSPKFPTPEFLQIITIFYFLLGALLVTISVLNFLSAVYIGRRRRRNFSLLISGLNMVQVPLGTALGIYTLLVLCRNNVRSKYEQQEDDAEHGDEDYDSLLG